MSGLNRVVLIGRMTRDPELRTTNAGKSVVEFALAVDKRIKPVDSSQPTADFFRCKAWGATADFVSSYLTKGRLAAVEGRIETRKFVDKEGNNREVWEIVCDSVQGLDRPRDDQQPREQREPAAAGAGGRERPTSAGGKAPSPDEYDPFADE